ncbi:hypothetical protein [Janthinobacterium sp. TND4EL3]|uniref:hypothetical protein n=1 Tax=Janthinobacterium sp. TND4EL3 TaxID=1907311 RepID=UPI00111593F5|nr:hypothetical protein [Janthinobacterium sp. TND4EL3]
MRHARAAGANGSPFLLTIMQIRHAAPSVPAAGRSFQLTTVHFRLEIVHTPLFSGLQALACHATVIFAA